MTRRRGGKASKTAHARLASQIVECLHANPVDVEGLRSLAPSGFETRDLRRKAWAALLGLSEADEDPDFPLAEEDIPQHHYFDQINKDIDRSMCHFDVNKNPSPAKLEASRRALHRVIHSFFVAHPNLHYFQGFHDICSVFLIVCNFDCREAYRMIERTSLSFIRDSHRADLNAVLCILNLVFPLLERADPEYFAFLSELGVQSFIALPWVLTWLSHNIEPFNTVCRVFDFLLSSHPLMCVYLSASLLLQFKPRLVVEDEFSTVHLFFQKFPQLSSLQLEQMFARSESLFASFPPSVILLGSSETALPSDSPMRLPETQTMAQWKLPLVLENRKRINRKKHPSRRVGLVLLPIVAGVLIALAHNVSSTGLV